MLPNDEFTLKVKNANTKKNQNIYVYIYFFSFTIIIVANVRRSCHRVIISNDKVVLGRESTGTDFKLYLKIISNLLIIFNHSNNF